ncbi:MAG: YidC/Oxa1 family membrane protein insertase [bacterium]
MFKTLVIQPLFNLLVGLHNIIPGQDLGITIIALTIVIKLVLAPLSHQSLKSQKALQELQPKINELKSKHKDDKQALAQATMEMYKQNKVNPFSSCLPVLIQLPFLYGIFEVLRQGLSPERLSLLYPFVSNPGTLNQLMFGLVDLAKPSWELALLAALSQFWQSKMLMTVRPTMKTEGSKDEDVASIMNKQMVYVFPALTFFIGLSLPSGLALYWLVSTLFTVVQQYYAFRGIPHIKQAVIDVK